jgi:hypothetical protein
MLSRNRNLDLNSRLQTDARLQITTHECTLAIHEMATYDLLHNLAGGVEVDQALVDLELEAIPGLRTFTTRLRGNNVNESKERGTMSAQFYAW